MKVAEKAELYYPNIGKRIKAVVLDSVIFAIVVVSIWPFIAGYEFKYNWLKILILLSPFFILEPLLVTTTGGSIGHHVFKIRVRGVSRDRNINIINATIRFLLKTALGTFSLLFILFTKKHQALHDYLVNSIVIFKQHDNFDPRIGLKERVSTEEEGYVYPSKLRRFIVILIYNVPLFFLYGLVLSVSLSDTCLEDDICIGGEDIISFIIVMFWFAGVFCTIYFGFAGKLVGCRRKIKKNGFA